MAILDQYGNPISTNTLTTPQTSRSINFGHRYLDPALQGLTPAKLAATLKAADDGDLLAQHRLFADMEERDMQIAAEFSKRKMALQGLDWHIVPPKNPTPLEEKISEWVEEILSDAIDPLDDLILHLLSAIGHGFACAELEWNRWSGDYLPQYHPRPHEWFRLDAATRSKLHLNDYSADGAPLQPFGWVWHSHGKAKTGYAGRMGLYRSIVWPFLYKAYALGDFAEFLETFGLPIITGKYYNGATEKEKASLFHAVTQLGHDARAIMPQEMQIEIHKIASSGSGSVPHLLMVDWADKAISKLILGGTLTSGADGASSTNALGNVHNEVRHDILESDARQIAATITRDLIYPLIALNRGGIESLRRCPRLEFDSGEAEDLALFADALPKLIGAGMNKIPLSWVHKKLRIPQADKNEEVLGANLVPPSGSKTNPSPTLPLSREGAAMSAVLAGRFNPNASNEEVLQNNAQSAAVPLNAIINEIANVVSNAKDLASLQQSLLDRYGQFDEANLIKIMEAAFVLAQLQGMIDVREEAK